MAESWPLPDSHKAGDPEFTSGINQMAANVNALKTALPYGADGSVTDGAVATLVASGTNTTTALDARTAQVGDDRYAARTARSRNPGRTGVNPPPQNLITSFQSGHGWTLTGGDASSNLNDTSDAPLGTQSAVVVTDTASTSAVLKSAVLGTAIDMTGKHFRLLIKIENVAGLTDFRFYDGNSGLGNAKNRAFTPIEAGSNDFSYLKENTWGWITVPWASGSNIGTPNRALVQQMQYRVQAAAGQQVKVHFGAIATVPTSALFATGAVSFTYDDGRATGLNLGRQKLDQYGWAGTAFPIRDKLAPTTGGAYVTVQQLLDAKQNSGWEISCHADLAADHDAGFSTLSPATVEADLASENAWFYDNGFGVVEGFAWPRGMSSPSVEAAARKAVAYGRGIYTSGQNIRETIPPANPMRVRALSVGPTTTLATLSAEVDFAVANGTWIVFVFHEIVASPSSSDPSYSLEAAQSVHDGVIDYIAGLATKPAVLPMIEVLRRAQGSGLADNTTGGDLSGTLNAPKVAKVNGVAITNTPTTSGQVPVSTGTASAQWAAPPSDAAGYFINNRITAGESSVPRMLVAGGQSTSSGTMLLGYFTAEVTETITQLAFSSHTTAAGATPTLARYGLYSVDGSGNATLLASTANDTALFAAANTRYAKTLSASVNKVAGQRYAVGVLVVNAATMPSIAGASLGGAASTLNNEAPRLVGMITGQSDLPASFTEASLNNGSKLMPYAELLR